METEDEAPAGPPEVNPSTTSSKWCSNSMSIDFDPGASHGREIFKNKTRSLPEDKKLEVVPKDVAARRKYLLGKQGLLGGISLKFLLVVTRIVKPTNL